jgi:glucose/mannose-6-phosphate isomerase
MRDTILSFSRQLAEGIELGKTARVDQSDRHIISCGMGGSSIAGEMLSQIANKIIIHWDYDLPTDTDKNNLVICTSWSGQTEETISSYERAIALSCDTLVITTGGRLAELARQYGTPLIILPHAELPPRMAQGYMAGALFSALGLEGQLPADLDSAGLEEAGKSLAGRIGNRIPVIYTSYPWRKLTGFWKMAYSETAKRQVMVNWFPSGAHTEIVGWQGPYQDIVTFVLLRDSEEASRYAKNLDALLALLPQKGYTVYTVGLSGNTPLEKVFNSYILALWTGWYSAQALQIDPNATELLDEFKRLKAQ